MTESAPRDGQRPGFTLLGDQPYPGPDDPLEFQKAVGGIESLVLGSRESTPFTLGIEGSWGSGKSTLMAALEKRLADRADVTVVRFNAWMAEDGRALEGFVKTILGAVKPHHLRNALLKQRAIGLARFGFSSAAGLVGQSRTVEKVWDAVASDPRARNSLRDLVEVTIDNWRKGLRDEKRLLCVFVDDLDRCYPKVVLEVLEAMKLYLDVPGIVFVVGYDEDIVTEVVLKKRDYGEKTTARNYLEKFIQISYRIPRAEETQSKALIEVLLRSSGIGDLLGDPERRLVVDGSSSNPRRIKRFLNSFVLVYELDPRLREFRPQSLVRVLLLQMYFPEFARLLEDASDRDPVKTFLEYEAARTALRREAPEGELVEKIDKALRGQKLPVSRASNKSPKELFDLLEENIPPESRALVLRADFAELARNLYEGDDWDYLRGALSGGALAQIAPAELEEAASPEQDEFAGVRVLWVDDEIEQNSILVERMRAGGAEITTTWDQEGMTAALSEGPFDVLISDIARGDDPEAGFQALERLRRERPADVPEAVIFFTARKTPARIRRAKVLDAEITTSEKDLLDYVAGAREPSISAPS